MAGAKDGRSSAWFSSITGTTITSPRSLTGSNPVNKQAGVAERMILYKFTTNPL
jgi:hypothetical protein